METPVPSQEDEYARQRQRMVEDQIEARGILDERVLAALRAVPRHRFVRPEDQSFAYADGPLAIGNSQTISQPYIVALMSEMLELTGSETVLEVGTGSGYQAAVLAHLARTVHTIERHSALAERARSVLTGLGLANVTVHVGDGSLGLAAFSPYQAILVTAAAPETPAPLLAQLADEGRLVLPVGGRGTQFLECWIRHGERFERLPGIPVAFVPLRGAYGWQNE